MSKEVKDQLYSKLQVQLRITKAREAILDGLYTDGAHHKQEALERALMELLPPEEVTMLREQYGDWDYVD